MLTLFRAAAYATACRKLPRDTGTPIDWLARNAGSAAPSDLRTSKPLTLTRLVNTCWAFFRGVLTLAVLLAVALGAFLYFRLDDEAQRLSEVALNRYCTPFVARVGSASFTPGRGVTMRNVEIVEPVSWRSPRGVLQVEELQVEGNFDLGTLLRGRPIVTRVIAKSPKLAATRRRDGTWNLADIEPPAAGKSPPPTVELRNATVMLTSESRANQPQAVAERFGIHHLNAILTPSKEAPGRFEVRAEARDTFARTLELNGTAQADGSAFELAYKVDGLAVSPDRFQSLAKLGVARVPPLPFRGLLSVVGRVASRDAEPLVWNAAFTLASGECRMPNVKRPLTEIQLTGEADASGLRIDRGDARWGDASLVVAGRRDGWSLFAPIALRCRATDYDLASTPVAMLPERVAKLWERFRPLGRIDASVDLAFDGARFAPRATITARDASFEDGEKFPYRLANAAGQILVNGGASDQPPTAAATGGAKIDINLHGAADGAPIHITAAFEEVGLGRRRDDGPRPLMPMGWVEVSGNGVPISDRLVNAVQEEGPRGFIQSLHPSGRIDVSWRAERKLREEPKPVVSMRMRLANCRLQYDRFPYPLSNVTGWIEQKGSSWRFYELRSRDTQGRTLVEGFGSIEPQQSSCGFELELTGQATPLDQTLFDALPDDAQQAWAFVRPRGQMDFNATITRRCGEAEPRVRLKMKPHKQNLAIEPPLSESGYRYRLERVDGDFEWADDRLTMRNARGGNGRTVYSTDGSWEALGGGAWRLDLRGLQADRLEFSREFLLAAPPGLRTAIEDLKPRGGFDLFDSRLEVTQKLGSAGPIEARWKISLNCHQASIDPGVPLDGISGVIRLGGASDGSAGVAAGELDLDSVFWNDLQLTEVRGPLWADENDCFLGEGVAERLKAGDKRPITAKAYGGDVSLNSWVRYGVQPRYGLAIGMGNVDVTRLAAEWLQRPETIDGRLNGTLELQGAGSSIYGLTGKGAMTVSDADLYELPLFLSMLKYLRNRAPDNTAFNELETRFAIEGNDLRFDQFDLKGDAVSLYGRGTATLDRDVDLTFASVVGRSEFSVPVLKAFVSSASEQLLRLRVVGPADNPEIRRELLPMVGNMFEQLQAEFGGRVTSGTARPGAPTRR